MIFRTMLVSCVSLISTCLTLVLQPPPVLPTELCKPCNIVLCPSLPHYCPTATRVNDPCGCCADGVCPAAENEPCSPAVPCDRGYFCDQEAENIEGVCTCRRDKRAVCASDNSTYISICQMENQPHRPVLLKWGHCDSAPQLVSGGDDVTVTVGQPVAIDCEVKGSPIPSITWYFNGKDGTSKILPSDDQVTAVLVRGGPEHMMVTSWMQIVEARISDHGLYTCEASNQHGTVRHQVMILCYYTSTLYHTFGIMKAKSNYRQMQAMAKKLGLPGNLKHNLLEAMVEARQSGNEAIVDQIIKENKEERERKRREKAEVRQNAQRNSDIYQNGMDHCGLREPPPPPVKRPQGRPRKNRLPEVGTPQQANRQLVHVDPVNTNQRELSQLDEETLLQSASLLDLLKLYDSAYNNSNSSNILEYRPNGYQLQGKARNPNSLYSHPVNMPMTRSSCRYSAAPAQHPKPVNYGKQRLYNEAGFSADLHRQHYSKLKTAAPFATSHYQDGHQSKYGPNLSPYTPASHHLNNEYKSNCTNTMSLPVTNSQGLDFTYVPRYGCFQPQPESCFPCTTVPSSSDYNILNHHHTNQPAAIYYENYKTQNNENMNESNFLYGDDNHQGQIMSTTPCSESTVSANELIEDPSYNNISNLPADNSLTGNTSPSYILPSSSISYSNIDGKQNSEPCTSQLYFYPTPTFHFEQNPTMEEEGCTNIIPETLNTDYKKEIFEEHPVELSVDNLDTSDYCNEITEPSAGLIATTNSNEVLPDLQQLVNLDCKQESIANPKKEIKKLYTTFVVPQGVDSGKTIIDEILEEGNDEGIAVSNEDLDNLIILLAPRSETSRVSAASSTKSPTTQVLDCFVDELVGCNTEESFLTLDFPFFNEASLRTYQTKVRKITVAPIQRESLTRASKRYR